VPRVSEVAAAGQRASDFETLEETAHRDSLDLRDGTGERIEPKFCGKDYAGEPVPAAGELKKLAVNIAVDANLSQMWMEECEVDD